MPLMPSDDGPAWGATKEGKEYLARRERETEARERFQEVLRENARVKDPDSTAPIFVLCPAGDVGMISTEWLIKEGEFPYISWVSEGVGWSRLFHRAENEAPYPLRSVK